MQEGFEELLSNMSSADNQLLAQINEQFTELKSSPLFLTLLLDTIQAPIIAENRLRALAFLRSAINSQFKSASVEDKANYLERILFLTMSMKDYAEINSICACYEDIIKIISINSWPRLFDNVISGIQSQDTFAPALKILSETIGEFSDDFINSHIEDLTNITNTCLASEDWFIRIAGIRVFCNIYKFACKTHDLRAQISAVAHIAQSSFPDAETITSFWMAIEILIRNELLDEESLPVFVNCAVSLASHSEYEISIRIIPLHSIVSVAGQLNEEQLGNIFDIELDIAKCFVEQYSILPYSVFDQIENALQHLSRYDVYVIVKNKIIQYISMDNREMYVTAICVLALLLVYASETVYADTEFIISTLEASFQVEDDLISAAACSVIDHFDQGFLSITTYSDKFAKIIIPLLVSKNEETRTQAFGAMLCLEEGVDIKIPGFFDTLWSIMPQVEENDLDKFISILATSILETSDFGDQQINSLLEYFDDYLKEPSTESASILLLIQTLVYKFEYLYESLVPRTIPILDICMQTEDYDPEAMTSSIIYIGSIFTDYPNESKNLLGQYVDILKNIVSISLNEVNTEEEEYVLENNKMEALISCCKIAKACGNTELASEMQEVCCLTLFYESQEVISQTYESIELISKLLQPEPAKQLFVSLCDLIGQNTDQRIVGDAMKPLSKLLKVSSQENLSIFLTKSINIVNSFINGELTAQKGNIPLSGQCDHHLIVDAVTLMASIVRYQSEYVDQICEFMLQACQIEGEASIYVFIGALSDAVKFGTCSASIIEGVLQILPSLMNNNDIGIQQNISFLLNIILQKDSSMENSISSLYPTINDWYLEGMSHEIGYGLQLSNIASLYLTICSITETIDEEMYTRALAQFPPSDIKETTPMVKRIIFIYSSGKQLTPSCIRATTLGFSELLLLNESELKNRKITQELYSSIVQIYKTIISTKPEEMQFINEKYSMASGNLMKLNNIISS